MRCCVPFCKSDSMNRDADSPISFHEFPSDERLRLRWILTIGRQGENGEFWLPSDYTAVCSRHFTPSDYKPGLKIKSLKKGVSPSVFEDYPPERQRLIAEKWNRNKR